MVYTPPNTTFKDEMILYVGGREIRIKHYRGHTRGDAVIHLPDENILITGDLVIHPVPYGFRTFFREWVKTFNKLMNINSKIIITGHGDIQYSNDYMQLLSDLFSTLLKQADDAVDSGLTLDEFRDKVDLESFRLKLAGDDPDKNWAFENYFLTPAVERAFRDAKAEI